jgi:hypothetical protein
MDWHLVGPEEDDRGREGLDQPEPEGAKPALGLVASASSYGCPGREELWYILSCMADEAG